MREAFLHGIEARKRTGFLAQGIVSRHPAIGIASTLIATFVAVNLIPDHPEPEGALLWPALVLSAGLLVAPIAAAFRQAKALLRAEHLLVMAPIYWLLLDLLQGAYPMDGISVTEIEEAFVGIGIFVCCVWIGSMGRSWRVPSFIKDTVSKDLPSSVYFYLAVASFLLVLVQSKLTDTPDRRIRSAQRFQFPLTKQPARKPRSS